jgi:hypothetical protein
MLTGSRWIYASWNISSLLPKNSISREPHGG